MQNQINSQATQSTLSALYKDARARIEETKKAPRPTTGITPEQQFELRKNAYMCISSECGNLLYSLARTSGSKNIVEFGTSFGLSTIYLASAIRDNGGGKLITTEYFQEKAETAISNFRNAEVNDLIDVRIGDALETLKENLPETIDFLFLDGAKSLYRDVFKMLEPRFKKGTIIVSDNIDHKGMEEHLEYVRNPENGYSSTAIMTLSEPRPGHHEITTKN